ncbi:acylphosphatase [Bordetella parapertussis]|uniref:Acylphosphatase n=6 Tax=Bordetella TaxID=517 RepID=ACYP_BORBR|nr:MULTISPECIES: acylphosphatase [Bordetella]Q7W2L1.1 RecName: Full=Acylphosphatase; AltName: Full=Acylphosphate phosphohydrolase [Bordetella parapertussis 12822]Q7WDK7.1 RecName: Full=Acylphosphatase; AltName: Full=Acylphosphate phosphohydrolase [Bordetella bronchiseptica RB50]KAK63611.1 acylphosphatase [Bordetella bronchiseptica 980-2]SHP82398.1 acylphosphatase [Mycobacteroides abscessus subsp. abscessus]AMG86594.1 acylphosphatase [Bordetella bronchiseptica]AOB41259.1 acylphosphatase [Borde
MSDAHMETVHVIVKGKVQGVGYRHAAVRRAHMLGVTGWVQNLPDGTVEAVVQGTADQVDHMLEWLRRGPPAAQVRELASERSFEEKRYKHFAQL